MCGIAGAVGAGVASDSLAGMGASLVHRGPDGTVVTLAGDCSLGFAHTRLAIIDLTASGSQPMKSRSGVQMVYNGEIYNYVELREELQRRGATFRGTSDTEVLLAAYDHWGVDCLPKLNGMFAFALYDPRSSTLFAARDRLGEKPLYYTWCSDGTFVFASEVKGLLAFPGIRANPDYVSIYRLLAHREIDRDPQTFFTDIYSVPAAHSLELPIGTHSVRLRRYWTLRPSTHRAVRPYSDLVADFRDLFIDSVRLRLRSDVPVGSSLSGGLDSSSIVGAIATLRVTKAQHTFSARFPGTAIDEGRYIDSVVEMAGVTAHTVIPDARRLPDEWQRLAWHQESPFLSLSVYAQWCVMRLAAEAGVTVLLDGQGADEILAGYRFFMAGQLMDLVRRGRVDKAIGTLAMHVREAGVREFPAIAFHALPRRLAQRIKSAVRAIGLDDTFARTYAVDPQQPKPFGPSTLASLLHASLTSEMLPTLLRYGDRNSMAFSRELRLPFLDHRLIEYAFSLPDEVKLSSTRTKVILRDAMRGVVPAIVTERRDKLGYAVPQTEWLRGPLREWSSDLLHSQSFVDRPWIDARIVSRAWRSYINGANRYEPDILRWLSLEGWARAFLDRPTQVATAARDHRGGDRSAA